MIKNGLYSLAAVAVIEVGGVLILHDAKLHGGGSCGYYTGTYDCSDGKWKGEMISNEHTPTTRPGPTHPFQRYLQRRRCRSRCHSPRWQAKCSLRRDFAAAGNGLVLLRHKFIRSRRAAE